MKGMRVLLAATLLLPAFANADICDDINDVANGWNAIANLVELYGEAIVQEDIDRLQSLFPPETLSQQATPCSSTRQAADSTFTSLSALRDYLSDTFQNIQEH